MAYRAEIADFGDFYERTYQGAFRTALGIVRDASLAADVTQDAYAAAYQHRDRFRGEGPSAAWLYRIVVNHALSAVRRRQPVIAEVDVADAGFAEGGQRPDHSRASSDRLTLFAALDQLTPKQRAAVVLRYYLDYDYATIAEVLGTTTTNVGAMLSRALDRLRVELETPQSAALAEATR